MKCRGKLILFADADGASKFSDFERLENTILKNSTSLEVIIVFVCSFDIFFFVLKQNF